MLVDKRNSEGVQLYIIYIYICLAIKVGVKEDNECSELKWIQLQILEKQICGKFGRDGAKDDATKTALMVS